MKPELTGLQELPGKTAEGGQARGAAPRGFAELLAKAGKPVPAAQGTARAPVIPPNTPVIPTALVGAGARNVTSVKGEPRVAQKTVPQTTTGRVAPQTAPATATTPPPAKAPVVEGGKPAMVIMGKAADARPGRMALINKPIVDGGRTIRAGETTRTGLKKIEKGVVAEKDRKKEKTAKGPQLLPHVIPQLPGEPAPISQHGKPGHRGPAPVEAAKAKALSDTDKPELPGPTTAEKKPLPTEGATRAAVAAATPDVAPVVAAPPPPPAAPAPILQHAIDDPGLRVAVLPHTANVAIENGDDNLSLHVRVKDGAANIRISGTMAPMFEARVPEIQAALATQGLALGRYDLEQQGRRQDQYQPHDAGDATSGARLAGGAASASSSPPSSASATDGRIHVTA